MSRTQQDQEQRRRRSLLVLLACVALLSGIGIDRLLAGTPGGGGVAVTHGALAAGTRGSTVTRSALAAGTTASTVTGRSSTWSRVGPGQTLRLSGTVVGGVAPGAAAKLYVTVTNPGPRPVLLASVTASVVSVGTRGLVPTCLPRWYQVSGWAGHRVLGPALSARIALVVTFVSLATVDQDDCKGVRYALSLRALGTPR